MMRRQLIIWGTTALATCVMLIAILARQEKQDSARWSIFLLGDAHQGARLFTEKGCAHCHAVNGVGGKLAPDLGIRRSPESSLPQLVTAMWNHAPRMLESMKAEKMSYPDLTYEDMAHLFSYLYVSRYVDEPGDPQRGRELFESKGCVRCHALHTVGTAAMPEFPPGNFTGAQGAQIAGDSLGWTQAMWNHAVMMETRAQGKGISWPRFAGHEMNDLVAFLNEASGTKGQAEPPPADPARGWDLFQKKGCIRCHSVQDDKDGIGPSLGPKHPLPDSFAQFAGSMWNHIPDMFGAMKSHGVDAGRFEGRDMADLVAFLYSLHYFEPGGSPQVGESVFSWRGCAQCHGALGEGTRLGPALRGRGQTYTSIRLATVLWRHGAEMSKQSKDKNFTWPNLQEADVGHLLSFLNSPVGK
jgi:cytochrome c551/c552